MARRPYRVLRPAHKCQTPVEAIELALDMQKIDMAMQCVKDLLPESIDPDRERAHKVQFSVVNELRSWHMHAQKRLKTEFLGVGDKPKN